MIMAFSVYKVIEGLACRVVGFVYISVLLNCSELAFVLSFNVKFGPKCLPLFSAAIAQAIPLNIHTTPPRPPLMDDVPFSAVLQKQRPFKQHQVIRKPQTAVTRLQFRVAEISRCRDFKVQQRRLVQFIFIQPKYNTIQEYIQELQGCKGAQKKPEGFVNPGLSSLKEISKIKRNSRSDTLKIGTKQRLS